MYIFFDFVILVLRMYLWDRLLNTDNEVYVKLVNYNVVKDQVLYEYLLIGGWLYKQEIFVLQDIMQFQKEVRKFFIF